MKFTVQVTCRPDGTVEVMAQDLTGDRWRDFLAELNAIEDAENRNDHLRRNRSIRNAIHALHAHVEGIVNYLWELGAGKTSTVETRKSAPVRAKIREIRQDANKRLRKHIPPLHLSLKAIRDGITHPGGADDMDVLRLSLAEIRTEGNRVAAWLDKACKAYGVTRFADTKVIAEQIAKHLGRYDGVMEI